MELKIIIKKRYNWIHIKRNFDAYENGNRRSPLYELQVQLSHIDSYAHSFLDSVLINEKVSKDAILDLMTSLDWCNSYIDLNSDVLMEDDVKKLRNYILQTKDILNSLLQQY